LTLAVGEIRVDDENRALIVILLWNKHHHWHNDSTCRFKGSNRNVRVKCVISCVKKSQLSSWRQSSTWKRQSNIATSLHFLD